MKVAKKSPLQRIEVRDSRYRGSLETHVERYAIRLRGRTCYLSACRDRLDEYKGASIHQRLRKMDSSNTTVAGRYTLGKPIGRGGVGEVWRATQQPLNRPVALKLLRQEYAGDAQIRRRFAREARAASALAHPNVAAVFDFGTDDAERLYIAMELIEGPSVVQAVERGLSLRNILELADQLLAGLAHAHARGVIHRDLKPDNIVLSGANLPESIGIPKLVDFGIATIAGKDVQDDEEEPQGDRTTLRGEVVGTPRYMSPEQATGERNLSPRTDIYNVGLILYELITGKRPFGEDKGLAVMSRHVHDPIPPIEPRDGLSVPADVAAIILKALEKAPLDRWGSAAEMRAALRDHLDAAREFPGANVVPLPMLVQTPDVPTPVANPQLAQQASADNSSELDAGWDEPWQMPMRAPFVGRDRERQALTNIVERVTNEQQGVIVLLSGEAGVGKTRLTTWLKEQVEEQGLMRANTGAFSRGSSSNLRGVQDVLESMFRTRGLPRNEVQEKIVERLKNWEHPSPEDARALTDFLRPTGAEETRPSSVSTAALFAMLAQVFESGAQAKPRLVILDDIHWAGRELADFLDFFAVELRHRKIPVLVAATIRSEDLSERPELASRISGLSRYSGETVEKFHLQRFGGTTGKQLVEAMLPIDDELAAVVLERSSGNPLHLSFLLRYLRDEGLLHKVKDRWVANDVDEVRNAVPPSLGDLFRVRIEQAESHYNIEGRLHRVLRYAAFAGPRFQFDVLQNMIQRGGETELIPQFEYDLDRLVAEGLLKEIEGRGLDWYGFSHGLLRDFLLNDTGHLIARSLHRNAAEAKADVYAQQVDVYAMEIANHWMASHNPDHALQWYLRAADSARRSFLLPLAAEACAAALSIMDDKLGADALAEDPLLTGLNREAFERAGVDPGEYLVLLSRLGDLLEGFSDFPKAEDAYRRVVRIVGRDVDNIAEEALAPLGYSWLGLGHIAWQRGDFEAAEWAFKKARELGKGKVADPRLDTLSTLGLARVAWHRADYEFAEKLANSALHLADRSSFEGGRGEAKWILGEINRLTRKPSKARKYYVDSMDTYRDENDQTGLARNLLSLAQLARVQKDFAEAKRLYLQALSHYEKLGDRRGSGLCQNGLGDIARLEQRYPDADRYYSRALDIYEGIGAEYDIAVALANLGLNAMALGDPEAAESYLEASLKIVSNDYPYLVLGVEFNLALARTVQGDDAAIDEALMRLDEVDKLSIADIDYARPLEALGQVAMERSDVEAAAIFFEAAGQLYGELGLPEDAKRVAAYLNLESQDSESSESS